MAVVAASLAIRVVRAINLQLRVLTKPGHEFDRSLTWAPAQRFPFLPLNFSSSSSLFSPCFPLFLRYSAFSFFFKLFCSFFSRTTHSGIPLTLSEFFFIPFLSFYSKWIPASFHWNAHVDSTLLELRAPIQRFLLSFISLETKNVSRRRRRLVKNTFSSGNTHYSSILLSLSPSFHRVLILFHLLFPLFSLILFPSASLQMTPQLTVSLLLKIDTCLGRIHTINWSFFFFSFCHLCLIVGCLRKKDCNSILISLLSHFRSLPPSFFHRFLAPQVHLFRPAFVFKQAALLSPFRSLDDSLDGDTHTSVPFVSLLSQNRFCSPSFLPLNVLATFESLQGFETRTTSVR